MVKSRRLSNLLCVLAVLFVLCVTFGFVNMKNAKAATANAPFAMTDGASVRITEGTIGAEEKAITNGMRFQVKLDATTYASINETNKLYFFVAPVETLDVSKSTSQETIKTYFAGNKKGCYEVYNYYQDGDSYVANAVFCNFTEGDYDAVLNAIAFITDGTTFTFATAGDTARSMYDVVNDAVLDKYSNELMGKNAKLDYKTWYATSKYPVKVNTVAEYDFLIQSINDGKIVSDVILEVKDGVEPTKTLDTEKEVEIATLHTVTWKNADGTTLEVDEKVVSGTTPTYDGVQVTDFATATTAYKTFTGWTPNVEAVSGDVTYTAVFDQVTTIGSGVTYADGVYSMNDTGWGTSASNVAYTYTNYGNYTKSAVYSVEIACDPLMHSVNNDSVAGIMIQQNGGHGAVIGVNQYGVVSKMFKNAVPSGLDLARRYDLGDGSRWDFATNMNSTYALQGKNAAGTVVGGTNTSVTLTLVMLNDTLYIYCQNNLVKQLPLTNSNYLKWTVDSGSTVVAEFTANGEYQFGLLATGIDPNQCATKIKVLTEKYGDEAVAEMKSNSDYAVLARTAFKEECGAKSYSASTSDGVTFNVTGGYRKTGVHFLGVYSDVAVISANITVPSTIKAAGEIGYYAGFAITSGKKMSEASQFDATTGKYDGRVWTDGDMYTFMSFGVGASQLKAACSVVDSQRRDWWSLSSGGLSTTNTTAKLTAVLYNNYIYIYVNDAYIGNKPITELGMSLIKSNDPIMFGVCCTETDGQTATITLTKELYGEKAKTYISQNYAGTITVA